MKPFVRRVPFVPVLFLSIAGLFAVLGLIGCKGSPKETPGNETTPKATISTTATTPHTAPAAGLTFDSTVKATQPLAYYRLEATKGASEVGSTTYEFTGGATSSSPGAATGVAENHFALLNGKDGWIKTTQMGGVDKAGSVMAWVNLAALPSTESHIVYVAGESQNGNDFDLQFEGDNSLRFYTAAGENVKYAPDPSTLVNHWHMIVATMDTSVPQEALYWDGQPAASNPHTCEPSKTAPFAMGESPVFTGRFFDGGIDEVALWDRALSPAEVAAIFKAVTNKP